MAAWNTESLGSIAEMASDKISVSKLTAESYISTENMLPDRGGVQLAVKLPPSGSVNAFFPGDVLFSNIRTYFKKVWLAPWQGGASADVIVFRSKDGRKLDSQYLYYVLSSDNFIESTVTASKGTKMPRGDKEAMRRFEFPLPPLPIQRRIAGILSAYDELIENSQRRIKILESMARALYREWFVHFRFPGHESVPRVPSPLGEIPQGWEVGRLDAVLVLQRGFDLPRSKRVEGEVPIYAATGVIDFHNEAKVKAPGVVTGRSGTIGDVIYVQEDFWPLNTALWAKEFPKSEPLFAYYFLSSIDLKQFNAGAAVPTLNRNDIHGLDALIPPRYLQRKFQDVAGAMLKQARTLGLRIENLRRTRDLLLPRLLSGQIDVESLDHA